MRFSAVVLSAATLLACQGYNMEEVEPKTVVAVETYETYLKAKAPTLLIVQDRSASMEICFDPGGVVTAGEGCRLADETQAQDRRSRMVVARDVMERAVGANEDAVWFGLVAYGVPEGAGSCGPPAPLVEPAAGSGAQVREAYRSDPLIVEPWGGTPTTAALESAHEMLVTPGGDLRFADRENYVVLVTDGLMNCNEDHPMPCTCSQEVGCVLAGGGEAAIGDEGELLSPILCLDDAPALAEVRRLRDAGVKTFVIGLGDTFAGEDGLSVRVLDDLAVAGGVPRENHPQRFYSAGDEAELEGALNEIIESIAAPCTYELDGPVCDGRLVKVSLRIDGEVVQTSCDEALEQEAGWFFVEGPEGSRDPQRIAFSPQLCEAIEAGEKVEVSIRGVENACPDDTTTPACTL